jgi:NAD-dependent deacetylase
MTQDRPARLVVFSGAGLSADSGISTFRDADGLWENHSVDVVANGHTWKNNFDTVRKFYNERRADLAGVAPNAAHRQIADWQKRFDTVILTQNVDDLLERAGCTNVIHLHGNLTEMRCTACGNTWDIGYAAWGEEDRCLKCNSLKGVRPQVVFFNEAAPLYSKMYKTFREIRAHDTIVVIGTSGQVINLDAFMFDALCLKILNNLGSSQYINESYYDHVFYGKASDMCSQINQVINTRMIRLDLTYNTSTEMKKT